MRVKATVWAGLASAHVVIVITSLAYLSVARTFETNQRVTLDGIVDGVRSELTNVGRLVTSQAELVAALPTVPKLVATNADYAVLVDDRSLKALATSSEGGSNLPVFNGLRVDSATDSP